jgi:hypothetical protein
MRSSLILPLIAGGLFCLGAATSQAQQQESRIDKILKPDMTRQYDYGKTATGSKAFNAPNGNSVAVENKSVGLRKFDAREYLTGGFQAQKTCWMGDFKYALDEKKSSRFLYIFPTKNYKTQTVATKDFSSSQKKYSDAAVSTPTRDYRGQEREKLKQHLTPEQAANNGYRGDLQQLKSIDDVRALLNKNK